MSEKAISHMRKEKIGRGRPRRWHENMSARFEEGTLARMEAVLKDGETKTDFVNAAVVKAIELRERRK